MKLSIYKLSFNFLDLFKKKTGSLKIRVDPMDRSSLIEPITSPNFCDLKPYQDSKSLKSQINLLNKASLIIILQSRHIICLKNSISIKFSEYNNIATKNLNE